MNFYYAQSKHVSKSPTSVTSRSRPKPYARPGKITQPINASKSGSPLSECSELTQLTGFVIDKIPSVSAYEKIEVPDQSIAPHRGQSLSYGPIVRTSGAVKKRYFDAGCAIVPHSAHDILKPNPTLIERQITSYGPYVPGELRWHVNGKPTTMAKKRSQSLKRSASIRDMFRGHPSVIAASQRTRSPSPPARQPQRARSASATRRRPRAHSQPETSWGKLPTIQVFFRGTPGMVERNRSRPRINHTRRYRREDPKPPPEPQEKEFQEAKQRWINSCAERDIKNIVKIFRLTAGIVLDDGVDMKMSRSIHELQLND